MTDGAQNPLSKESTPQALQTSEEAAASGTRKFMIRAKASAKRAWNVLVKFFQEQFAEGWNWLKRALLIWRLFWKRGVGLLPRLILVAAVVYVISPLDFVPVVMVDDLGIILLGAKFFLSLTPEEILAEEKKKLGLPDGI